MSTRSLVHSHTTHKQVRKSPKPPLPIRPLTFHPIFSTALIDAEPPSPPPPPFLHVFHAIPNPISFQAMHPRCIHTYRACTHPGALYAGSGRSTLPSTPPGACGRAVQRSAAWRCDAFLLGERAFSTTSGGECAVGGWTCVWLGTLEGTCRWCQVYSVRTGGGVGGVGGVV